LDLVGRFEDSLGMKITTITQNNQAITFRQYAEKVTIYSGNISKDEKRTFTIEFEGIPTDGLIIGQNKFGDRTFFADNWPMRAKHWFACVDHPSDKAMVKISVEAPYKLTVVSNGIQKRVENLKPPRTITNFESTIPIPTKVIVFGAANFEKQTLPRKKNQVEITNFVYPQDKEKGFKDFGQADTILAYFEAHIGKFPFEKLYNVQSTTIYGGMENAGCIFYDEKAIVGKGSINELIAHEIVHQWFGNSASELDWPHLWLSEGFATYLTDLYIEDHRGENAFRSQMDKERRSVISFYAKNKNLPLEDHVTSDVQELLNTNAYKKGAWVLHMLRHKVGTEIFWKAIASYYEQYKFGNAASKDFIQVFENVSKQDLQQFYKEWILTAGHPILSYTTQIENGKTSIKFVQNQTENFHFSLEFLVLYEDNTKELKTLEFNEKEIKVEWNNSKKISSIKLDPNFKLLFEEKK
jgi:aminopeptidase N